MIVIALNPTILNEIGFWLDQHMPNPPLPEPPRWKIVQPMGTIKIGFMDDKDATLFSLRWN